MCKKKSKNASFLTASNTVFQTKSMITFLLKVFKD